MTLMPAIVGLIGLTGSVLGSVVSGKYLMEQARQQQSSENKRRYAEIYAGKKVQALSDLNQSLVNFHRSYLYLNNAETDQSSYRMPTEERYRNGIQQEYEDFTRVLSRAEIFFGESQTKTLRKLSSRMRDVDEYMNARFVKGKDKVEGVNNLQREQEEEYLRLQKKAQEILREEVGRPIDNFEDSVN